MKELFLKFLQSPNRESFLAVREALISSEHYSPYSDEMKAVDELMEAEDWQGAREKMAEAFPNLLLSPRAHLTLSRIVKQLGNEDGWQAEGYIAMTCCEGILSTGDGTRSSPYLVARSSDVYDMLQFLEKGFVSQALVHEDDRSFDCIHCQDGSELWFDITDSFHQLSKMFND